jgi:hypothetical protein
VNIHITGIRTTKAGAAPYEPFPEPDIKAKKTRMAPNIRAK